MNHLPTLLLEKRILICVGSGGVGKTTTAAALGTQAAAMGKKALVITIDPAKRLASSLGLQELSHEVTQVDANLLSASGSIVKGGELHAMMLDQKMAFDEVVRESASNPDSVKRVLENPIYHQISTSLAGSQEYAAMTKLLEFYDDTNFDLIIVDTPPTAHALDFLDAPARMTGALNSSVVRWFNRLNGGARGGAIERSGRYILKRLGKFVGSQFISDISVFFGEFDDVIEGFSERAQETFALLRSNQTSFVLVASTEPTSIEEATFFYNRLKETDMPFGHFIINRFHGPGPLPPVEDTKKLVTDAGGPEELANSLRIVNEEWRKIIDKDKRALESLAALSSVVATIEDRQEDVHSIADLRDLGTRLMQQ